MRRRPAAVLAAVLALSGCSSAVRSGQPSAPRTGPASAAPSAVASPTSAVTGDYLALGDSVAFGYIAGSTEPYSDPAHFVGWPTYVGTSLRLPTSNAACPGEATGGFLSATDPDDNGCRIYRSQEPLHVRYSGTQLQYAEGFLRSHPRTALVTLQLGANDGFLLADRCRDEVSCITSGETAMLDAVQRNLTTTVRDLRATGYRGPLLLVGYYSVDYTNLGDSLPSAALNQRLQAVAAAQHLTYVDVFGAMKAAAASAGGRTCAAHLLNPLEGHPGQCDVHPSLAGQRVIARAVVAEFRALRR